MKVRTMEGQVQVRGAVREMRNLGSFDLALPSGTATVEASVLIGEGGPRLLRLRAREHAVAISFHIEGALAGSFEVDGSGELRPELATQLRRELVGLAHKRRLPHLAHLIARA